MSSVYPSLINIIIKHRVRWVVGGGEFSAERYLYFPILHSDDPRKASVDSHLPHQSASQHFYHFRGVLKK